MQYVVSDREKVRDVILEELLARNPGKCHGFEADFLTDETVMFFGGSGRGIWDSRGCDIQLTLSHRAPFLAGKPDPQIFGQLPLWLPVACVYAHEMMFAVLVLDGVLRVDLCIPVPEPVLVGLDPAVAEGLTWKHCFEVGKAPLGDDEGLRRLFAMLGLEW